MARGSRFKALGESRSFAATLVFLVLAGQASHLSAAAQPGIAAACGNGVCDAGETKQSCPQDCRLLLRWLRQRRERSGRAPGAAMTTEAAALGPGDSRSSLTVDGRVRSYLLHLPAGYTPAKRYPLVLLFHGGHGSGAKIAGQTGFREYADREGFLLACPDGIERNWSDGRGTTKAEQLGVDDVKFVRALIGALTRTFSIDPARIYATGVSNGGIFSQRLGCELADVLAAIGPVVGPIASNMVPRCNPSAPISIVAIQGTVDPFIPVQGGEEGWQTGLGGGGLVESAVATTELWASKNGCPAPRKRELPVRVEDGTRVEQTTYAPCRGGSEVVLYLVEGMGHGWPPRSPQARRVSGPTSQNIDATQVVWEFFKAHPKPAGNPVGRGDAGGGVS